MDLDITNWGIPQWVMAALMTFGIFFPLFFDHHRESNPIERCMSALLMSVLLLWGGFFR